MNRRKGIDILVWTATSTKTGQAQRLARAQAMIECAAKRFNVKVEDVLSPGRKEDQILYARYTAIWALNKMGYIPAETARLLNRHHSSVVHALQVMEKDYVSIKQIAEALIPRRTEIISVMLEVDKLGLHPKDKQHLQSYIENTLFGGRAGNDAVLGLRVAARRYVCDALIRALKVSGYEAHTARLATHLRKAGYNPEGVTW